MTDRDSIEHTPAPWRVSPLDRLSAEIPLSKNQLAIAHGGTVANARLIAAAPDMLDALRGVRKLIAEAAMTGFNCHDGDWAERLFYSQQQTSRAIEKATGTGPKPLSVLD